MAKKLDAFECASCHKLVAVSGEYVVVESAVARRHVDEKEHNAKWKNDHPESVSVTDAVVCSNECLRDLLTLKPT